MKLFECFSVFIDDWKQQTKGGNQALTNTTQIVKKIFIEMLLFYY